MIFMVLYKQFNCAADKIIDTGQTASADRNCLNNTVISLMLFIASWCKPGLVNADPSREMCNYST